MSRAQEDLLDALRLALESAVVERTYAVARFGRVVDRLATSAGAVRASLAFRSIDGVPTGKLTLCAEWVLSCRRCLGPLHRSLESTALLAFVENEDAPVPEGHEAIPGDPERIDLAALVEDELILSMPLFAAHRANEDCIAAEPPGAAAAGGEPPVPERRRPFAGLKDLLKH